MKRYLVSWTLKSNEEPQTIIVTAPDKPEAARAARIELGFKKWFVWGVDELSDKKCDFCDQYAVEPTDVMTFCNEHWEEWGEMIGASYGQY
jgi:hypothetical protein